MTSTSTSDPGQQALNLSTNQEIRNATAPPAEADVIIHQPRRPQHSIPDDVNLIDTVEEEENIYDQVRRSSESEVSGGTPTLDQVLSQVNGLSDDDQLAVIQRLTEEKIQSIYPTDRVLEEKRKLEQLESDVEEDKDQLEHELGTVQVQKDDLDKRVSLGEQEKKISKNLNKVNLKAFKVKKVLGDMERIAKGEIRDLEQIGKIWRDSQALTKNKSDVIYSQVMKGKTRKVSYADADKTEDSDDYQDATDDLSSTSGMEGVSQKAKKRQPPRKPDTGAGGGDGGDPPGPSLVKESTSRGSSKYEKVIVALEEAIEDATEVLDDECSAKIKLSNAYDDLKGCLKMAKQTRIDHDPPSAVIGRTMNNKIREMTSLVKEVMDKIAKFNGDETLRKMLPQGSWPKWSGDQEGFLDFITTMKAHLPALKTDKLQLST